LLRVQRNRLKITNKIANKVYSILFLMQKNHGFLTIVWVSIPIQPKLSSSVHCFGQNSGQKVLPCKTMAFRLWSLVWRVKKLNPSFLVICLVVRLIYQIYTICQIHTVYQIHNVYLIHTMYQIHTICQIHTMYQIY